MAYGVKEIPSKFKKEKREEEREVVKTKYQLLTDRFEELDADVKDCEQFIKNGDGCWWGEGNSAG